MEISPSRKSLHTFGISVSLFPLDTVLSTLESDSLPRTSFLAHHKSALSHEFITLDDASCWLPLAVENQRHRRAYFLLLGEQWWSRPSHFFHIREFGGCDCGGEVVVVGVEAVSPRGVVDRRVLTAGIDAGIGLHNLWEGCVRPGGQTEILQAEWHRGISWFQSQAVRSVCIVRGVRGGVDQKEGNGSGTSRSGRWNMLWVDDF